MLHNILLKAGEYTEIAKQGKFINVVLAAGEITVRIRMRDLSVFETKLVSGMSFPVTKGFQSVAFTSNDNQQIKVWLGDLPLNYSPVSSKLVGSSALGSRQVKSFFGYPLLTIEAKSQRGKITMQASKPFFVGGAGVAVGSGIYVEAYKLLEINTQGAVYTYSENAEDKAVMTSELSPLTIYGSVMDVGSTCDQPLYNHIRDEFIFFGAGNVLQRVARGEVTPAPIIETALATVWAAGQKIDIIDDNLVFFGFYDGSFCKSEISLIDYSENLTILVLNAPFTNAQSVEVLGGNFLVCDSSVNEHVYTGKLDGSYSAPVNALSVAHKRRGILLGNGDVALVSSGYLSLHVTADLGVNWEERPLPDKSAVTMHRWCVDELTGVIVFAADTNTGFYYSEDNGLFWSYFELFGDVINVYTLSVVDGEVFVSGGVGVGLFNVGSKSWESIVLSNINQHFKPTVSGSALVSAGSGTFYELSGVKKVAGGMLINIMEELN